MRDFIVGTRANNIFLFYSGTNIHKQEYDKRTLLKENQIAPKSIYTNNKQFANYYFPISVLNTGCWLLSLRKSFRY